MRSHLLVALAIALMLAGCGLDNRCAGGARPLMCSEAEAACYQTHDQQACAVARAQDQAGYAIAAQQMQQASMQYQANTDRMIDQMNQQQLLMSVNRLNHPQF